MKKTIKRIIIANTGNIKEIILSIPSFFMVKKMYPDAEIIIIVRKYTYEIVRNLPYIDRFFVIEDYKKSDVESKIAYFNADVFIALYNDAFVEKLAKASKAWKKIGPITNVSSLLTYKRGLFQNKSKSLKNEAEYNLDLIKKLDKKLFKDNFEINTKLYLSTGSKVAADTFFKENAILGQTLVVNPFNSGKTKNITDEQFAALIKNFKIKNRDTRIIIICHIDQEERVQNFLKLINEDEIYSFPNGGDLLNIAAIIDKADVYLGPLAGPTQMAGALKKRSVVIYPNRKKFNKVRWGLYQDDKVVYIVPDSDNPKENYKNKSFDTYNEDMQNLIITELDKIFKYQIN